MITCISDADCNGEGECVRADDGSFYCDCALGFIEPHCKNRDPCQLDGNTACQNGSTCKRRNNFEYECKCRVPYGGEFCETYNLCEIDVDECIGDLNTDEISDPICHPCVAGATCTQISKQHYTCTCEAGFNQSSCYAFPETDDKYTFLADAEDTRKTWNRIIPTVAISSFCLYFILFLIILIVFWRRKKRRPKLIVCCDIKQFDNLSYYLISVETGRQWCAGVNCSVYCFLCGENGHAGPYPLSDLNLVEVRALQRCLEDNYLVSSPVDLGRVDKIVIWYDKVPSGSSWFCEKITVRNVKTDENWYFYISKWFHTKDDNLHEFLAATTEFVRKQSYNGITCKQFWHQVLRHHSYISPFVYTTPDRITIMFVDWMSYMLILIALYGFLLNSDSDIRYTKDYVFSLIAAENGSLAALSCFFIAFTCALLLMILAKVERIPTLIVWRNKPGMARQDKDKKPPVPPFVPPIEDKATNTDINDTMDIKVQESNTSIDQNIFRIPSTDVIKTEKWVQESVNSNDESEQPLDEALVHSYISSYGDMNIPQAVIEHGLIGGLTDGRQQAHHRFVYTTTSDRSTLRAAIENEVREIYTGVKNNGSSQLQTNQNSGFPSANSLPISEIFIKKPPESTQANENKMAAGDYYRDQLSANEEKQVKIYCELCEMTVDRWWNRVVKICTFSGRALCWSLILAATIIAYTYGGRYGYQRTCHWLISLAVCWVESFMAYQFIKVLLIVLTISILIKRKKMPSFETAKLSKRFQVYYVNGLTVLPEKSALKFVLYMPKKWIPAPHVTLHSNKRKINSRTTTSIKTHGK